jgi:hypothetical protein
MTELTNCELCLYHSAGAASCGCYSMQFVAGSVRTLKIMVMKGLKNYPKLYFMNTCFSHRHRNVTVTKFVSARMSVTLLLLICMTVIFGCFYKILKSSSYLCVVCL